MYDAIIRFLKFLLPILRSAAVQVTADTLNDIAYPTNRIGGRPYRPRPRPYASYSRPSFDIPAQRRVGRNPFEHIEIDDTNGRGQFHDVLLVAIDITGPNSALAQEYIQSFLPPVGENTFRDETVNVDSWWIANDERHDGDTDTDSAVFVAKGNQEEARKVLRDHGLVR